MYGQSADGSLNIRIKILNTFLAPCLGTISCFVTLVCSLQWLPCSYHCAGGRSV